jgi:hypothetical protein
MPWATQYGGIEGEDNGTEDLGTDTKFTERADPGAGLMAHELRAPARLASATEKTDPV